MPELHKTSAMQEEVAVQNQVVDYYEELRYQRPYSRFYHEWWTRKMLSFLTRQGRMLDNGCGIGILSEVKTDFVCGLDISSGMIKRAKGRNPNVVLGNSEMLPFPDGTFDVVFARSLIHHLQHPEKGIGEMNRVLVEGGEIVLVDTNKSILSSLPRRVAKKGEHFSDEHKNLDHRELLRLLSKLFRVDKIYFFGYLAYPLAGFPDLIDFLKYVPFSLFLTRLLIHVDSFISMMPGIKTQSWGIMIKGTKI